MEEGYLRVLLIQNNPQTEVYATNTQTEVYVTNTQTKVYGTNPQTEVYGTITQTEVYAKKNVSCRLEPVSIQGCFKSILRGSHPCSVLRNR